jgi:WD40 repeat protein
MDVVTQRMYMLTAHHTSAVTAIEFSPDGKRFATCSAKGTMIRIFASATGDLLYTLRRGTKDAVIDSIVFSASGNLLAVTSNASTLHVFRVDATAGNHLSGGSSGQSSETEMRSFIKITVREGAKYAMGIRNSDEQLYLISKPTESMNSSRSLGGAGGAPILEVYQLPRGGGEGRKSNELKLE